MTNLLNFDEFCVIIVCRIVSPCELEAVHEGFYFMPHGVSSMFSSDQMVLLNKHNVDVFTFKQLVNGLLVETSAGSLFLLKEDNLTYVGQLES